MEPERNYSEREINETLRLWHTFDDPATLRRELYDNFFVDKDGIEIGMTYHYRDDEQQKEERGWITAPFTMEEIKAYKTDSDFWNLCTN